jgi:hypothetical protein
MSVDPTEMAQREFELMTAPGTIRVRLPVRKYQSFWLPTENGSDVVEALFKVMTLGDNVLIEKACTAHISKPTGEKRDEVDINEMRRLVVKRNLLSWNLPIEIERANGWMTPESYRRVSTVSAPLMEALLSEYEGRVQIGKEEEDMIHRQSAVLFSKNSRGVSEACEAVSLFCTLGNFWDKFGFDRLSILEMPYREFLMLKIMIGKEGEAHRIAHSPKPSNSRVAMGGRIRPSRATPQPGL